MQQMYYAVRWTITDRRTGFKASIPHPLNERERDTLRQIIHNVR